MLKSSAVKDPSCPGTAIFQGRLYRLIALLLVFFGAPILPAQAHALQVEPTAITLRPQPTSLHVNLSGNIQDILQIQGEGSNLERRRDTLTESARRELERYIDSHLKITQNGKPLVGALQYVRLDANADPEKARYYLQLRYDRKPGGATPLELVSSLYDYLPNASAVVARGGPPHPLGTNELLRLAPADLVFHPLKSALDYLLVGLMDLVAHPEPILFLLGAMLVAKERKHLVIPLIGFGIAATVVLMTATVTGLPFDSRILDALVALSVVYVGLQNLFAPSLSLRGGTAIGLGLIYGLAFASHLRDAGLPEGIALGVSLLAFAIGIAIVLSGIGALIFPLVLIWKRGFDQRARNGGLSWATVVQASSWMIVVIGGRWLAERLFGGAL